MKKIIILIFSIFISLILIPEVKAVSVTKVATDYYYTRYDPDGTRNSDRFNLHYIDDKIVYCIEPGVKLGTDYNIDDSYNIPYENKLRILLAAHYGYFYQNNKDYRYALATQSIIWKEITGKYPVFSTKLFEQGDVLDLTYFITQINNNIKRYINTPNILPNKDIIVGNVIDFEDKNNVLEAYDISSYDSNIDPLQGNKFQIYFTKSGDFNFKISRNKYYDSNYKVYTDSNKQKLLMPGNIPELDYETTFYVKPLNIHFKIIDSETKEEIHDVTLKVNDSIIKDTDTYTLNEYKISHINFVSVPDKYILNNKDYTSDNFGSSDITIKLKLEPFYNDYIINKTYDDIYPEENAIFELINNDSKKLEGVYYTDSNGTFKLHLKYGNYTLNQLKGIEGYTLVSKNINNTHPNLNKNSFTINLNDEKIIHEETSNKINNEILNNDEEEKVDIIDHPYTQEIVSTGNNISLLLVLFLFTSIYLLNKKIIAI